MVVIKTPKQIKTPSNLKIAVRYILNEAKTLVSGTAESDLDFPLVYHDGELQMKLVSGNGISDFSVADEEMVMTKLAAAFKKGDDDLKELSSGKQVLAHHIIQSFSPDDNLTPEQVHEIGRQTMLELTGGNYEFVIATHTDKDHLHNHIILNTTNTSTLKKFRWEKKTLKNLRAISDKYAARYGAKIIEPTMKNSYTKYSAWRRQNNYRFEIKERLDFLLKHSLSLEDFKHKAAALDLQIDFSGKFVKYKLLDQPQQRNVRDDTLSKKGLYSLEKIKERISKNQLVFDVEELKEQYQESKEKTANDFELKLEVESWQVEQESKQGIYVQMDMGALNSGTILIPSHKVDKNEDGNYTIYIKEKDYFYFLNPDQSQKNRYMMGLTVARQLAKQNGETLVTKNAQISSMRELIKEYNFLVEHGVTDGTQFQHLEERFNEKIEATQEELRQLDERLGRYHKIEGALLAIQKSPENSLAAVQLLDDLGVPKDMGLEDVSQLIKQFQIEKGALQEFFDDTLKHYTDYRDIKEHVRSREEKVDRRFEDEKTL
ncbi:relaxase/mobilization nuclease domain-containing protein [Streptococcus oralis]|jgi:relaxase|uniref:relaxase/mobilization nuclease domain-containing protein n=1 Tax=Streptococcus oralis TaxID=1303 RepID=UPI001D078595|nr:relaxase/mobilization nuclease domain-containing protein [Streptococcus oralis]MCB7107777.1 relaxase/mobilization nuclease domain-containing protein [Streptococcus oralis]MCQ5168961.1 relaxase/mobilization nuclease domain-containing protein [Streptococcus oralis]